MRWLLLINLLAVVLLAGAVAVLLEGTRFAAPATQVDTAVARPSTEQVRGISDGIVVHEPIVTTALDQVPDLGGEATGGADVDLGVEVIEVGDRAPVPRPYPRSREQVERIDEKEAATEVPEEPIASEATKPRILKIVTEGDFPPFNFVTDTGRLSGFDIDTAQEVCTRLKVECQFGAVAWDELRPTLVAGEADLIAASLRIEMTPGADIHFSQPYYASYGRFAGHSPATDQDLLTSLANGASLAVQAGTIHAAYLTDKHPALTVVLVPSLADAQKLLETRQVDFIFADNAALLDWAKAQPCCHVIGERVTHPILFGAGIGFAMRAEDDVLRREVDAALAAMKSDGTLEALSQNYFAGRIF